MTQEPIAITKQASTLKLPFSIRGIIFIGLLLLQTGCFLILPSSINQVYRLFLSHTFCLLIPTILFLHYDNAPSSLFGLKKMGSALFWGTLLGVACFFLNVLLLAIIKKIHSFSSNYSQTLLQENIPLGIKWLCLALEPAIAEELLFKALLIGPIFEFHDQFSSQQKYLVFVLVSILFAFIHFSGLYFVPLFVTSFIICLATMKTGSIYTAIMIHLVNNSLSVLLYK